MIKGKKNLAILGTLLVGGGIWLATQKKPIPTPGGAFLIIKIVNLPTEANQWGCAFQDINTGEYYQPTNRPIMGSHLFSLSESAELSPPKVTGILSISAFAQVSVVSVTQIVNYQIGLSFINENIYIFDFSTGTII